jgi:hypothetical protein
MADSGHSPELDRVRKLLFPDLSPEEGWARIDDAVRGAAETDRVDAIEELVAERELDAELVAALRQLRERERR